MTKGFLETFGNCRLTNCLKVIRNEWHFDYALVLAVKVVCRSFGIASEFVQFNGKKRLMCSASFYVVH
ncbi:DUF3265 domain-containing protein [Vibrio parahaemolyticus]|nr:DUF3265 domain-containing protein [Vibrio parahaemolyticus]